MRRERFRIGWARLLDRFPGRWLVWLCALRRGSGRNELEGRPRKILFIKLWGMGSVILSQPALAELRRLHPGATLHYLTFEQNRDLFEWIPEVDKVHAVPFHSLRAFLKNSLWLIGWLRRERYDLIVDAEFLANYSTLVARISSPKASLVGFSRTQDMRSRLLDVCVPLQSQGHVRNRFLDLVRPDKGGQDYRAAPRLRAPRPRPAGAILSPALPVELGAFLVVNVNAGPLAPERRWPRSRFVELAGLLLERYDAGIVLIGSASERPYVEPVAEALAGQRVLNLCGELTLGRLASLLQDSSLLISNDSGPLHLAAALDVPLVGFFGPESPTRYGPVSRRRLVFYRGLPCSPCMSVANAKAVRCSNGLRCLQGLEVSAIAARLFHFVDQYRLLKRRAARAEDRLGAAEQVRLEATSLPIPVVAALDGYRVSS